MGLAARAQGGQRRLNFELGIAAMGSCLCGEGQGDFEDVRDKEVNILKGRVLPADPASSISHGS